jgi:hypothetical protein
VNDALDLDQMDRIGMAAAICMQDPIVCVDDFSGPSEKAYN